MAGQDENSRSLLDAEQIDEEPVSEGGILLPRMDRRGWMGALLGGGASLAVLGASGIFAPEAEAQRRRRRRRGGGRRRGRSRGAQVYITQARVPRLPTEQALLGWARSHNARILNETTEEDLNARKWLATMVVHFQRNVGDLEYQCLFYDLGRNGNDPARFVSDMAFMLNSRDERTFVQPLRLPRRQFPQNHSYEMKVTVRRTEMGSVRFALRGQDPVRTGQVDFTSDG